MPDKAVIQFLESKYDEQFEVISSDYIAQTGNYNIRIKSLKQPEIIFKVDHNPKRDHFNDYYPYAIWQYEADQLIRELLNQGEWKYALRTNVSSNLPFEDEAIPTFEDLMNSNPETVSVNLFLHLFGDLDSETIEPLIMLDEYFRSLNLKKVGFTTAVYHPFSIKDKAFDELNFDFGISTESSFEIDNEDHFLGLLKYRINPKNDKSPTPQEILDIVEEKQNHMLFKKL